MLLNSQSRVVKLIDFGLSRKILPGAEVTFIYLFNIHPSLRIFIHLIHLCISSHPISFCSMIPYPIQSSSILQSYPFKSNLVLSYLIPSCHFLSNHPIPSTLSNLIPSSFPILSYPIIFQTTPFYPILY